MPSSTATIRPASGSNMVQLLSKTRASTGVSSHSNEEKGAKGKVDEIEHALYPIRCGQDNGLNLRQESIRIARPRYKERIKIDAITRSGSFTPPLSHPQPICIAAC